LEDEILDDISNNTLEKALSRSEADALIVLKSMHTCISAMKRYATDLKVGKVSDFQSAMNEIEKFELIVRQQIATMKAGWTFDVDTYLDSGAFIKEILAVAEQKSVRVYERDERIYSYPNLVRLFSSERAVSIDKKKERRIRPTVLVEILKDSQKKPTRSRPEPFLEALYRAYKTIGQGKAKTMLLDGTVIPLIDIWELLTLLPGQAKDYPKQEFTRDVYLLHKSGVIDTRDGAQVSFPFNRNVPGKILSIINEDGEEKKYYGIMFTKQEKSK
jgi:hypothetical protein